RQGHSEASVELCKLAGLYPGAVICEIIKENGEMAKADDLEDFSKKHKINIYTIKDLIDFVKHDNKDRNK
ncbi:MAG: 3,4-dihydroxy-2-butanone-4-phosphate synthase, partial [Nanoarchaeota archaeon]|nr:3,4-dihydroxy-2-butanone-4-phosphate synthase [Nanoarchaeota archaeon]MBU1703806.1 3,4-dihydroxy-2-butanone-4-phosphate synthase [Nanoarchaeota archaeon]